MKKFLVQSVLLLLVIGIFIVFFNPTSPPKNIEIPFLPQPPHFSNLLINGISIKVEIADSASKRAKGLGGRTNLVENEGMLFIFERADRHPFWMKGLAFPLDFVWIKDNKVVDILENVSPPAVGQKDADLPIYSSKVEVDRVLEVNAGTAKKLNIKIGDTIKLTQ